MKGFVPTPEAIVDLMVEKLFRTRPPRATETLLDPGCGRGAFIDGIVRWCTRRGVPLPTIIGIDSDPEHVAVTAERFADLPEVRVRNADFLRPTEERFDFVIGNPPYVAITSLSTTEREAYRRRYVTAVGRFDLYLLFFEQALSMLEPGGRLVFITPEKYLYVETARALRDLLSGRHLEELHLLPERTFEGLVTYPLVTTVAAIDSFSTTRVSRRDGAEEHVSLRGIAPSWQPLINGYRHEPSELHLSDVCSRISCGVATGADAVFVVRNAELTPSLRRFAHPTIAGRQIRAAGAIQTVHSLLLPYGEAGDLLAEDSLGSLGGYLLDPARRSMLLARTCVARKPWYAFHETPPLDQLRRPKLLCKDITPEPFFVADEAGDIIPRHSVYYVIPDDSGSLMDLQEYLNSDAARGWMRANCQRAANGYLRMQSHVLKRLPVPDRFACSVDRATPRRLPLRTPA